MTDPFLDFSCPYCGEPQSIGLDPVDAATGRLVADCTVCCRPIHLASRRVGSSIVTDVSTEDRD